MSKYYVCPVCGKNHEETKFTIVASYICSVDFDDDGYYVDSIKDGYDLDVPDGAICCNYCDSTFDKFVIKEE